MSNSKLLAPVEVGRDPRSSAHSGGSYRIFLRNSPHCSTGRNVRRTNGEYLFSCAHIGILACALAVAWYDTEQSSVTSRTSNRPKTNGKRAFNAQDFLDSAGIARKVVEFKRKDTVFSQGDVGNNVLYI